jgi:hydrophobic/amphiphilic exporter-1 (mainly G- bacteria), HAE1 family
MSPADASAGEAARRRFGPIIMTSIAFILGVVPLLTADGAGAAPASSPTVVFSGIIASTLVRHSVRPGLLCADPSIQRTAQLGAREAVDAFLSADRICRQESGPFVTR